MGSWSLGAVVGITVAYAAARFVAPEIFNADTGNSDPLSSPPTEQHIAPDADLIRTDIATCTHCSNGKLLYMVTADQLTTLIEDPKELGAAVAAASTVHHYRQRIEPDPNSKFIFENDTVRTITVLGYDIAAVRKFGLIHPAPWQVILLSKIIIPFTLNPDVML